MTKKKTYTAPEAEIVRIAPVGMMAQSSVSVFSDGDGESEGTTITEDDYTNGNFEFNSNAFGGGLLGDE